MVQRRLPYVFKGKEGTLPFDLVKVYSSKSTAQRVMKNINKEYLRSKYKPELQIAKTKKGFGLYSNY